MHTYAHARKHTEEAEERSGGGGEGFVSVTFTMQVPLSFVLYTYCSASLRQIKWKRLANTQRVSEVRFRPTGNCEGDSPAHRESI